jgi:signal transduction histidine kinase
VDLRRLVEDMVEEIRLGDHEAHQFRVDAATGLAPIISDPQLLRHILSNLLSNAVRYSPVGTLITVRLWCDAWRVELEVADQGIGVPVADRARIFEAFERGSNVSTIKGTGLGLNIVKRMVELLGGQISVISLDPGSCFVVALPLTNSTPPPT